MAFRFHHWFCTAFLCGALFPLSSPAAGQRLFEWGWRADTRQPEAWQRQPSWQSNPSPRASCVADGETLCFAVPDAEQGMKWSQAVPGVAVEDRPFLVLRYRAEGEFTESNDYLVYLDGMQPGVDHHPVRLGDVASDGHWRSVGVYLPDVTRGEQFSQVAIQVRTGKQGARLWVAELGLVDRMPEGAERLHASPGHATLQDWNLDLASAAWRAEPSWLGNPADKVLTSPAGGRTSFRLFDVGRGMKWQRGFTEPLSLDGYAYAVLRYQATATAPRGDYTVCLLGRDGYEPVILSRHLRHDGGVHTVSVPLGRKARDLGVVTGIAVQAQAEGENAMLDILRLGFSAATAPVAAREYLGCRNLDGWADFRAVSLSGRGRATLREALDAAKVTDWLGDHNVLVDGVPFALPFADESVPMSGIREQGEIAIPVNGKGSQLFLLVLGIFRGPDEPVYGRGRRLSSIPDIDRFGMRVEYADGTAEACFPFNVAAGAYRVDEGAQVLCVFTDAAREVRCVVLRDGTPGAAFVVPALTVCEGGRVVTDPDDLLPDFRQANQVRRPVTGGALQRLFGVSANAPDWGRAWTVTVDGQPVSPAKWWRETSEGGETAYACSDPPLRLTVTAANEKPEFRLEAKVTNRGERAVRVGLSGPVAGPFLLGDGKPGNQWYMFPCAGAMLSNRPFEKRSRYGGTFPLQFMAAFNPVSDEGVYMRTLETAPGPARDYCMRKTREGMRMWLEYPERELAARQSLRSAVTHIGLAGGDWRTAFGVYRDWLSTWYQPSSPRKRWFRDVFNFRQRFLHAYGPLYDTQTGSYDLQRAVVDAEKHFGGLEFMHIFDWGNVPGVGRVYGRVGDHSPFEGTLKGGTNAFREAISGIREQGIRVGLYIEGYLLQEKGRLGRTHGRDWQIITRGGDPLYWPDSTEMMICSHVPAWRDVQAGTYAARVRELGVDGMYLDQFGFANVGKDCWSPKHGHGVPGCTVAGEFGLTRAVRRRLNATKQGTVLYTEEAPCDVNSQLQDGSFSYHVRSCRQHAPLAPFHPLRFAVPSFKTFEILVCDQPTGSWAEGVKWTFFNGEGIWLEGPAEEWFHLGTLTTIRKCHAILREYRAAFACDNPVPLEPTRTPGVFANIFAGEGQTAMTLYNARHRSVKAVVSLPRRAAPTSRSVRDAWNEALLSVRKADGRESVVVTLGPRDVGCIVFD